MATKDRERWRVRIKEGDRVIYSKSFPAGTPKKKVDDFERNLRLGKIDRNLATQEILTVRTYAKRFQEAYPTIKKRSHSTMLKDHFSLRDHILPEFGDARLSEVTASDVLTWQIGLSAKGLAPQTVNNIVACFSSLFRFAVLEGKAPYNPCASIPRIPRPKTKPVFWTPEEARRFLSHARVEDWGTYQVVLLAITTGLRPGETMGLMRDCIDFDRAVIDNRRHFCTKRKRVVDGLKNGPGYQVPAPRSVLEVLGDKRGLASDELVFPWLCKQRAFGWLTMKPLAKAAGVKYIGFHKLRHTFATHLVSNKRQAIEVRDLMGHKSLKSTEIYMGTTIELGSTDCIAEGLGIEAFTGGNVRNLRSSRH